MKHLVLLLVLMCVGQLALAEVAVVVNLANPNDLTSADVKRLFLSKRGAYKNGSTATPLNLPLGDPARAAFREKILKKSPSQEQTYWSKLVFNGKASPPKELGSAAEVLATVAADPTALGYLDASLVDDSVKVVLRF